VIRKFGSVDAAPGEVLRILLDIESWPQWMPNIRATRVLERAEKRILADVTRAEFGAVHNTRLEFLLGANGYRERQVKGIARKWEGDWRIVESKDGRGSIVSCKLDVDLGFYGFFMPGRLVQRTVDHSFEKIVRGIENRVDREREPAPADDMSGSPLEGVERIQVFATPTGLEIWLDERKYIARPSE
jgi:ribosome-associated toxin RatA of RatAB toxin-antitoxin module